MGKALDGVSGRRISRPTWEKGCKDAGELVTCLVLAGKMKRRGKVRNLILLLVTSLKVGANLLLLTWLRGESDGG